jgi:hypothetical protein
MERHRVLKRHRVLERPVQWLISPSAANLKKSDVVAAVRDTVSKTLLTPRFAWVEALRDGTTVDALVADAQVVRGTVGDAASEASLRATIESLCPVAKHMNFLEERHGIKTPTIGVWCFLANPCFVDAALALAAKRACEAAAVETDTNCKVLTAAMDRAFHRYMRKTKHGKKDSQLLRELSKDFFSGAGHAFLGDYYVVAVCTVHPHNSVHWLFREPRPHLDNPTVRITMWQYDNLKTLDAFLIESVDDTAAATAAVTTIAADDTAAAAAALSTVGRYALTSVILNNASHMSDVLKRAESPVVCICKWDRSGRDAHHGNFEFRSLAELVGMYKRHTRAAKLFGEIKENGPLCAEIAKLSARLDTLLLTKDSAETAAETAAESVLRMNELSDAQRNFSTLHQAVSDATRTEGRHKKMLVPITVTIEAIQRAKEAGFFSSGDNYKDSLLLVVRDFEPAEARFFVVTASAAAAAASSGDVFSVKALTAVVEEARSGGS